LRQQNYSHTGCVDEKQLRVNRLQRLETTLMLEQCFPNGGPSSEPESYSKTSDSYQHMFGGILSLNSYFLCTILKQTCFGQK